MGQLYVTYCSAPKRTDPGDLPAVERYLSDRIAAVALDAERDGAGFAILSGRFGLVGPSEPLPWYDHLLQESEIDAMVPQVVERLLAWEVSDVRWFTVDPRLDPHVGRYLRLLASAAASLQIPVDTQHVVAND